MNKHSRRRKPSHRASQLLYGARATGVFSPSAVKRLAAPVDWRYDRTMAKRKTAPVGAERPDRHWEAGLRELSRFVATNGHAGVLWLYRMEDSGFRLGDWLNVRRTEKRSGLLAPERIAALDALGVQWEPFAVDFEMGQTALAAYARANGHTNVLRSYAVPGSRFPLGVWLSNRRYEQSRGTLSPDRVKALEALGVVWEGKSPSSKRVAST